VKIKDFRAVYPFEGYVTESVNCESAAMQIKLEWDRRRCLRCPDCGEVMGRNRESRSVAYDLPCGGVQIVRVDYPAIQGLCPRCGTYHTIRPLEIHPRRHATWRLIRYCTLLARHLPLDMMVAVLGVPAATAWRYDRDVLEADPPAPDLDGIEAILVDEKSVRRGHQYVTLVLNAATGELLHMAEGKKKESLEAFFALLSEAQKATIKAVCIDRNGAYGAVVAEALPGAEVVYDKFHLMSNLGKALDELRRSEYSKATGEFRHVLKGQRFNLLRHPENLAPAGELALHGLLDINRNLQVAYPLKDQFRLVWTYTKPGWARRYLRQWIWWVEESGIAPLIRFAKGIERDIEGVVAWCKHRITNARIESFNSVVSRIIFKARGIRSLEYLYLKLRQESLLRI